MHMYLCVFSLSAFSVSLSDFVSLSSCLCVSFVVCRGCGCGGGVEGGEGELERQNEPSHDWRNRGRVGLDLFSNVKWERSKSFFGEL